MSAQNSQDNVRATGSRSLQEMKCSWREYLRSKGLLSLPIPVVRRGPGPPLRKELLERWDSVFDTSMPGKDSKER